MTQSSRRNFLKTSAVVAIAVTGATGVAISSAGAQSTPQKSNIETKANEVSKKLMVVGTSAGSYVGSSLNPIAVSYAQTKSI